MSTTTTRDRGDRYGPIEWAQWPDYSVFDLIRIEYRKNWQVIRYEWMSRWTWVRSFTLIRRDVSFERQLNRRARCPIVRRRHTPREWMYLALHEHRDVALHYTVQRTWHIELTSCLRKLPILTVWRWRTFTYVSLHPEIFGLIHGQRAGQPSWGHRQSLTNMAVADV